MSNEFDEPAFPVQDASAFQAHGMTLRDYFAAKAMTSLIQLSSPDGLEDAALTASWAYAYADAMLKARAQSNRPTVGKEG